MALLGDALGTSQVEIDGIAVVLGDFGGGEEVSGIVGAELDEKWSVGFTVTVVGPRRFGRRFGLGGGSGTEGLATVTFGFSEETGVEHGRIGGIGIVFAREDSPGLRDDACKMLDRREGGKKKKRKAGMMRG